MLDEANLHMKPTKLSNFRADFNTVVEEPTFHVGLKFTLW